MSWHFNKLTSDGDYHLWEKIPGVDPSVEVHSLATIKAGFYDTDIEITLNEICRSHNESTNR